MQHLDEGTIHAWLDGALAADEAARVQRHAAECADCAPLVAEARGLVAGASRILSALDDVPAVVPGAAGRGQRVAGSGLPGSYPMPRQLLTTPARPPARSAPARSPLWSRPATLAAAASVVLMVGMGIVWREGVRPTARGVGNTVSSVEHRSEAAAEAPAGVAAGRTALSDTAAAPAVGRAGAAAPQPPPKAGLPAGAAEGSARRHAVARPEGAAPRRILGGSGRGTATPRLESATTSPPKPVPAAPLGQRDAAAAAEKSTPSVPPAPAPTVAADLRGRKALAPAESVHLADVVVTAVPEATGRRAAARRAAASRASSEQAIAAAGAEPPAQRVARADTVYQGRTDTVYRRGRRDTVFVGRSAANLRRPGEAPGTIRAFPVTGCYEVVEGRLPRLITLTVDPVWSGAAEQRFAATAKGAIGYWSQPRRGDVHLVIARTLVTARIDPSTGELRGTAHHGGQKERFVARRGCQ